MMESVGLDKGLIRFASENEIANGTKFRWTKRVKAYTALLILMLSFLIVLLVTRSDFEASIFRQRGSTFQMLDNGIVSNIFEINLTNKTKTAYKIKLELEDQEGKIVYCKTTAESY